MSRILVTGATGPIGRALTRIAAGEHELILAVRDPATAQGLEPSAKVIRLDLACAFDPLALPEHVDAVVHLAQEANYRGFPESAAAMFAVNTASTARILEWARRAGARHFVYASSGGLYGSSDAPISEDAPLRLDGPLAYYLGTKRASEILAEPYGAYYSVTLFRIFFAYGPGQKRDFLFPKLIRSVRAGDPIVLAGEQGLRLNPVAAPDAAQAILRSIHGAASGCQVVNLAGPGSYSLREVGEEIGRALGVSPRFEVDRAKAPGNVVADISKLKQLFGPPTIGLAEGLEQWIRSGAPELN